MSLAVLVASAEREAPAQKKMNLLPVWKYSLAYGLSGSIHISSMPRVTLIAPGIVPSRHNSRGSRISMKVTPGLPTIFSASAVGTVSISALASSTICCTVFFILSGIDLPPYARPEVYRFGTFSASSVSHTSGLPSEGARQSPRGDSEPPDEILGPLGSAGRLNWLGKSRGRNSASQWRISSSSKARMLPAGTLAGHAPFFTSCQAFHDR